MAVNIAKVENHTELHEVAELAEKIWHECFPGIISEEQISYMVDKFRSYNAMKNQVDTQDYTYFAVRDDGELCGYIGAKPESDERYFLSKLYLQKENRGKGYARQAMNFLEDLCRQRGLSKIWLTVNRHNDNTIAAYKAMGLTIVREQKADIGGGFFMDDYIMEKPVSR